MAAYSVTHQTPVGATKGIINLTGSAAMRIHLYELILGSDATPADVATELVVERTTSTGTSSNDITPVLLDPISTAAIATAKGGTFSADPTQTADSILLMIALNQRATFRWIAAPGREILSVVSAGDGLYLESVASTGTPNLNATMQWFE